MDNVKDTDLELVARMDGCVKLQIRLEERVTRERFAKAFNRDEIFFQGFSDEEGGGRLLHNDCVLGQWALMDMSITVKPLSDDCGEDLAAPQRHRPTGGNQPTPINEQW
jgi:hypothetical protein